MYDRTGSQLLLGVNCHADDLELVGLNASTGGSDSYTYSNQADYTLLPINPQEPGRFNVIRDFKMYVAPGYRMDYYKKVMLLQRNMLSGGRFYAGANSPATN